jgi:predicted lipoprotein with Yx(FWY)xxD motif
VNALSNKYRTVIFFLALAVISISILAWAESYTIKTSSDKFLGGYLVNQSNFTLYYFQNDSTVNGASSCYGECAALWTPFYATNPSLPDTLRPIDFGVITRTDGTKQTTFKGWPLYQYSKDIASGFIKGNGIDGLWHIINPDNQPQLI